MERALLLDDGQQLMSGLVKVAALRSPDGVMIGLYEPNTWENVTSV